MEPKTASPPEPFAGGDHLCQDGLYQLSPFKFSRRCWLPSRSIFGAGTTAYISRASHHRRDNSSWTGSTSSTHPKVRIAQEHLTLRRLFLLLYCSSSAQEKIHHHHTGVGYYTTTVARTSINLVSFCVASSSSSSTRS